MWKRCWFIHDFSYSVFFLSDWAELSQLNALATCKIFMKTLKLYKSAFFKCKPILPFMMLSYSEMQLHVKGMVLTFPLLFKQWVIYNRLVWIRFLILMTMCLLKQMPTKKYISKENLSARVHVTKNCDTRCQWQHILDVFVFLVGLTLALIFWI